VPRTVGAPFWGAPYGQSATCALRTMFESLLDTLQASSRCGTPDELKAMIDEAHRLGLVVLMDVVHSHARCTQSDSLPAT
jgi:hypothetical protein